MEHGPTTTSRRGSSLVENADDALAAHRDGGAGIGVAGNAVFTACGEEADDLADMQILRLEHSRESIAATRAGKRNLSRAGEKPGWVLQPISVSAWNFRQSLRISPRTK